MKKKPTGTKKTNLDSTEVDDFISGAEEKTQANSYPWQLSNVDDSKTKVFNLKLPESYALKLDALVNGTIPKISKQRYLLERLLPLIDKELEKKSLPK